MLRQFPRNRSKDSSSVERSLDRFELGIRRNKRKNYSGKNTVMSRMEMFNQVQDETQCCQWLGDRDLISSMCSQMGQLQRKKTINTIHPSTKVSLSGSTGFNQIRPQFADFSESGLLIVSKGNGVEIFDKWRNHIDVEIRQDWAASCVKFYDSENMAIAGDLGHVTLFNVERHSRQSFSFEVENPCSQTLSLAWDKKVLYQATDKYVKGRDLSSEDEPFSIEWTDDQQSYISSIAFKNNVLAVAYKTGNLQLYDIRMLKLLQSINYNTPTPVFCLEWCPWRYDVLTCGVTNSVWDLRTSTFEQTSRFALPNNSNLTGLAYLPFGDKLALSTFEEGLSIRDKQMEVQSVYSQFDKQNTFISCLAASRFQNKVVGVSSTKQGYVWDVPYPQHQKAVSFANYPMEMMMR